MGRIKGSTKRLKTPHSSDLVIEAIIEERKIKGDLFRSLNRLCHPESVFATNTSSLSVTDLAFISGRPDRFLGLHFFNPVHAMKLVEVIPGLGTRDAVVSRSKEAMAAMGRSLSSPRTAPASSSTGFCSCISPRPSLPPRKG